MDFDEISQKCSCHGPLQNFLKEFDSVKHSGCHGNKTSKKLIFETLLVRNHKALSYQIWYLAYINDRDIMGFYQVSSDYCSGVKFDPTPGITRFTCD